MQKWNLPAGRQTTAAEAADDTDRALTTGDACNFLSISRQTLYKLVKSKKIPGRKVGDNYRFLKSDLIRYFKSD